MIDLNHPTRRRFLAAVATGAALPWLETSALAEAVSCAEPAVAPPARPRRAVSLRIVSEVMAACGSGNGNCQEAAQLYGLARIDGFSMDAANRDVVLLGQPSDGGLPPLELQDLIVALRSSHGIYGERRGNTILMTPPTISLDPYPEVMLTLSRLDMSPAIDPGIRERKKRLWEEACRRPQKVRIEGIPRTSRLAKIWVDADYRMKSVTQGLLELPIQPPLRSLDARRWERFKNAPKSGQPSVRSAINRFFFVPGRFTYQHSADLGSVLLNRDAIELRDEQQSMQASGQTRDSGEVDPLARAFACDWTTRMVEIIGAEAIWREMHDMFRHIAIARIIAKNDVIRKADFDGDLLLNRIKLPTTEVLPELPGLGRVVEDIQVKQTATQTITDLFMMPVCGGVSANFEEGRLEPESDLTHRSEMVGRQAIAARPSARSASWPIPA
jgi:hypothetical protein